MNETEFDDYLEEFQDELEIDMRKYSLELYQSIKERQAGYFKGNRPTESLYFAYELLLYFLGNEEYEKCAIIRQSIDEFKETFAISKFSKKTLNGIAS